MSQRAVGRPSMRWTVMRLLVLQAAISVARKSGDGGKATGPLSETGSFLQVFGVARPLDRDPRGRALDLAEIGWRELDCCGSDVLFQALQLPGARDGNNPRLLGKQPGERDLSGCRVLSFCNRAKQINQGLIRFPSIRRGRGLR